MSNSGSRPRERRRWQVGPRSAFQLVKQEATRGREGKKPSMGISDATGADPVSFSGLGATHARADLALAE